MARLRRDILLIILAVVLSGFGTIVPNTVKNWTPIIVIPYLLIIGALIFTMVIVVNGIQKIDKRENEEGEVDKAKLNAIIKKLGITPEELAESKKEIQIISKGEK
jgi:hypothetical protein